VFDAKRLIGRHFSDPLVQDDMKHWPFKVKAAAGDKPMIEVQYKGEAKAFSPEEISSMVLVKMRDIASAYVGKVRIRLLLLLLSIADINRCCQQLIYNYQVQG
jgi:L1 cell adhesion molecule like protein